jgi:hypothetical protein
MNIRRKIAMLVVDKIYENLNSSLIGNPEFLLGLFGGECVKLGFSPTEQDARQIFLDIQDQIARRQLKATEELLTAVRP